jgi:hypothetical protein|nr:MAG TPA: hypothetical protein [Caudoviricetes sp.]
MKTRVWPEGIPAPIDANGCVVPLDTKELVYRGETREVYSFLYSIRLKCWFVEFWERIDICVSSCTMPDGWESLEEDARKTPRDYTEGRGIEVGSDGRVAAMARDLVCRAKSLAGVCDEG